MDGCCDGWIPSNDVWSYNSANSFTISGEDRTIIYTPGTRVVCKNNGVTFYGVVISSTFSTNTTVTLAANDDYSLSNSTISNPSYSYATNPQGYPTWFNYTPTYSADGAMTFTSVSTGIAKFRIIGKECVVVISATGTTGGSASFGLFATYPVSPDNISNQYGSGARITDGANPIAGSCLVGSGSIGFARYDGATWSLGSSRAIQGIITYGI